jgi:hypothetical protein
MSWKTSALFCDIDVTEALMGAEVYHHTLNSRRGRRNLGRILVLGTKTARQGNCQHLHPLP